MPTSGVTTGDTITEAWGDSVAAAITALEAASAIAYLIGGTDVAVADGGTGASTAAAARTNLGVGTGDAPQLAGVNVGHATDTTLGRTSAGVLNVEGARIFAAGAADVPVADGGTGASTAAAALTNLGLQHTRISAGAVAAGALVNVTVTWPQPFADTNYDVVAIAGGVASTDVGKITVGLQTKTASDCVVTVYNGSATSRTPAINAIAIHD